jgi:two-component system response regulator MprA
VTQLILIVDDDAGTRGWVQAALELEGYTVATAVDGMQALEQVQTAPPNLILLDLQLPVLSGGEILTALRAQGYDGPVVFMSAGILTEGEALARGADAYLGKPFDLDPLLALAARFAGPAAEQPN